LGPLIVASNFTEANPAALPNRAVNSLLLVPGGLLVIDGLLTVGLLVVAVEDGGVAGLFTEEVAAGWVAEGVVDDFLLLQPARRSAAINNAADIKARKYVFFIVNLHGIRVLVGQKYALSANQSIFNAIIPEIPESGPVRQQSAIFSRESNS
jgi:hypothetical protein